MSSSQDSPFSINSQEQRIEDSFNQISQSIQAKSPLRLEQPDQKINFNSYSPPQSEVKKKEQQLAQDNQSFQQNLNNDIQERKRQRENVEIIKKKDDEITEVNVKQKIEEKKEVYPLAYELMDQNSIKQDEWCCAVAFSNDQSIVIAGCNKDIKVFENKQGKLDQIQLLSGHKKTVLSLKFMRNTNHFVSGGGENAIIIWQLIGHHQWNFQQKLIGHLDPIFCLLLNNNDDLIISCSHDSTINFWIKQKQWLCQQTISDHEDQVYSLSLNEQQNKLISCSQDSQILVIEQSTTDNQWYVTQKIKVNQFGYRLCFIIDDFFIFQPYCQEYMHLYEMDNQSKFYIKTKQISVKCDSIHCELFFPLQYLKFKRVLINKNGRNVNIMSKQQNGNFIIEQSIEFNSSDIFGQLSDNGEYLITWDNGSKLIQIRRCKEL